MYRESDDDSKYSHSFTDTDSQVVSPDPKNSAFASPLKVNYSGMEKVEEADEESESPKTKAHHDRVELDDFRQEVEQEREAKRNS